MLFQCLSVLLTFSVLRVQADCYNETQPILIECLQSKGVPIVTSEDGNWTTEIKPFNLRFSPIPAVVATPCTLAQVEAAVQCGGQTATKINARAGGHSYGAYAIEDRHLMIDLAAFDSVHVDNATKVATVGAGIRLGSMASQLFDMGGRAMPHGTCAGVGLGGHALFGGYGLDSRMWGLALDQIEEMTAVLANGTAVKVNNETEADLFWALRGAGPSYAVITEFKLRTFEAPPNNVLYSYTWTLDPESMAEAIAVSAAWAQENAPVELGYQIVLGPAGAFQLRGVYYGSEEEFTSVFTPLLEDLQVVTVESPTTNITNEDWIESLESLAGSPLTYGFGRNDTFYAKSLVVQEDSPLSLDALNGLTAYLQDPATPTGNASWFIIANLYGGDQGSAINDYPPSTSPDSTSSYAHRASSFVWQFYASTYNNLPPFNETIIDFWDGAFEAMGDEALDAPAYAPYVDPELNPSVARQKYWDGGLDRLKKTKCQWDPNGYFQWPQGIQPPR